MKGKYAMTDQKIEAYRNRLNELTAQCSDKKSEEEIVRQLQELAREVGASTRTCFVVSNTIRGTNATTSELIGNIHQALQTASMVNMCKTATQGYEMATEASNRASKRLWIFAAIAFASAMAACISAVAAWAVV